MTNEEFQAACQAAHKIQKEGQEKLDAQRRAAYVAAAADGKILSGAANLTAPAQTTASDIIENNKNATVLVEFFKGVASCDYYDGSCYQLYLDLDDHSLSISHQVSDQSWQQRADGSLIQIHSISGYADIPEDERYSDGCDLMDYGYAEFIDMIEAKITEAIEDHGK